MSPKLSLDRLKTLLEQDEERQNRAPKAAVTAAAGSSSSSNHLAPSIDSVWRHMGVLPPPQLPNVSSESTEAAAASWMRPMSARLYHCPLSAPQTTLVPWKSLPAALQAKLRASGAAIPSPSPTTAQHNNNVDCHDDSPGIVEIPLDYLGGGGGSQDSGGGEAAAKRRPVQGNLSDKLTEYTRGIPGQRSRPFRPGGLEEAEYADEAKEDPYRTSEAVERSRRVLEQGSEASWKDKSLITAPPGVDFEVGLSWKDVHGKDDEAADEVTFHIDDDNGASRSQAVNLQPTPAGPTTSQGMFNRNYFDDDSLFGSSSGSDGEDDSESDDDAETKPYQTEADKGGLFVGDFDPSKLSRKPVGDDATTPTNADDDIEQLLMDLTVSDDKHFEKKKSSAGDVVSNPLELAEMHSKSQKDGTHKTWATDKLLPIDDFNAMIPNPALSFPFTLDDFQQQAVARLERSESVFVAAHTSAGKTVGRCFRRFLRVSFYGL